MGDGRDRVIENSACRIRWRLGESILGSWTQAGADADEEGALRGWSHVYRVSGNSPKRRLSTLLMISD